MPKTYAFVVRRLATLGLTPFARGGQIKNKNIEKAQVVELKKQEVPLSPFAFRVLTPDSKEIMYVNQMRAPTADTLLPPPRNSKLLLLGAGESGKSTIFRQMKLLYGKPFTDEELRNMIPVVHANILSNFLLVLNNAAPKGIAIGPSELADKFMQTVDEESVIDEALAANIKALWADPGVQRVWSERSTFQVLDSLEHYLVPETLDLIASKDYLPTQADILHARVRTSGIVEEKYIIDGVAFTMFDVGGQRNERKKWIHAFDGVTAVIFVAALNEYDLVLYEDNRTARMAESVKLFDEIANSQWFSKTSIILFLNKVDLFNAKLWRVPYRLAGVRNDDFLGPYAEDVGDREDMKDEVIQVRLPCACARAGVAHACTS